jgi:hypothetical protein
MASLRPSMLAAAFAALVTLVASGCTRDFDGLFARADAGNGGGGGGGGGDGGGDPTSCSPRATECKPASGCTGDTCTNTCTGCGCACPALECGGRGNKRCNSTCGAGTSCDVACDADESCTLACTGCRGKLTCRDHAKTCAATCDQGADCDVTCESDACKVTCEAGSACLLRCDDDESSCEMDCRGGAPTSCVGGVLACGRPCP